MAGCRADRSGRAPRWEGSPGITRRLLLLLRPLAIVLAGSGMVSAQGSATVELKAGRLSVSAEGALLADVLREVARRSGVEVQGVEGLSDRVSVRFTGLTLREGLEELLARRDYIVLGDLSNPAGQRPVRLIVLEPRAGPSPAAANEAAVDERPDEPAEMEEPDSEVAAPEEEPASDVDVAGEDGSEVEEIAAGELATPTPEALGGEGHVGAPVIFEAPPTEVAEETSEIEEPGAQIAALEEEPESGVEVLGEEGDDPD